MKPTKITYGVRLGEKIQELTGERRQLVVTQDTSRVFPEDALHFDFMAKTTPRTSEEKVEYVCFRFTEEGKTWRLHSRGTTTNRRG